MIRKEIGIMIKRTFMKASSVAVIILFFFPVLTKTWYKVFNLLYLYYGKAINYLLSLIEGNIFYGIAILVLIIIMILWILSSGSEDKISEEERSKEDILTEEF